MCRTYFDYIICIGDDIMRNLSLFRNTQKSYQIYSLLLACQNQSTVLGKNLFPTPWGDHLGFEATTIIIYIFQFIQ
jgi:hypothetical protein